MPMLAYMPIFSTHNNMCRLQASPASSIVSIFLVGLENGFASRYYLSISYRGKFILGAYRLKKCYPLHFHAIAEMSSKSVNNPIWKKPICSVLIPSLVSSQPPQPLDKSAHITPLKDQ